MAENNRPNERNAERVDIGRQEPSFDRRNARPQGQAAVTAPEQRTPARKRHRVLRWIGIGLLALVLLAAVLLGAGWIWAGSQGSLATALTKAAGYMPAGQTLQSREVTGSLRTGGHIGWLRWQSATLAVEVHDATIAWSLPPLLHRKVELAELHAAEVLVERTGPSEPSSEPMQPLEGITLPVEIDLPFRVDAIRWAGPPPVDVTGLSGHYGYHGGTHRLVVDGVDVADGHYAATVSLQGAAPMALDAALQARVRTAVPGSDVPAITVAGTATAKGTLATHAARLQIEAALQSDDSAAAPSPAVAAPNAKNSAASKKPGAKDASATKPIERQPLSAKLQASVRPWLAQPLETAHAELQGLDLARLWPTAPGTLLSGSVDAGPLAPTAATAADGAAGTPTAGTASSPVNTAPGQSSAAAPATAASPDAATFADTAWQMRADIRNAAAGPYDEKRLPVERLQASAELRDGVWRIRQGDVALAGGTISLQGQWGPAPAVAATEPAPAAGTKAPAAGAAATVPAAPPGSSRNAAAAAPATPPKPAASAPWEVKASLVDIAPGGLYTALQGPAIGGQVQAQSKGDAIDFDLALKAAPGGSAKAAAAARKAGGADAAARADSIDLRGLRLKSADAKGRFTASDSTLVLQHLKLLAADASVEGNATAQLAQKAGSAKLAVKLPGGTADIDGSMAPTRGDGTARIAIANAGELQSWVQSLPGLADVFAGLGLSGNARLDASWNGGYDTALRQLDGKAPAPGATPLTLKAQLDAPRLDINLPAPAAQAVATAAAQTADAVTGNDVVRSIKNSESNTPQAQADQAQAAIKTDKKLTSRSDPPVPGPTQVSLRKLRLDLSGSLADAQLALKGDVQSEKRTASLDTRLRGGLDAPGRFHASIAKLQLAANDPALPGPWQLKLDAPLDVRFDQKAASSPGSAPRMEVQASAGGAALTGPAPGTVRIKWEPVRFAQIGAGDTASFQLQSKGSIQNLPMAWAESFSKGSNAALKSAGLSGDLVFGASWDIDAADTLDARIEVARTSGDIRVQTGEASGTTVTEVSSTGTGAGKEGVAAQSRAPTTAAGIREARVTVRAQGDAVTAELVWDSERAGQVRANVATTVARSGNAWSWPEAAPLNGKLSARLPDIGVWSMFAPPGWRVAGTLEADAAISGARNDPRYSGTLKANGLSLVSVVDGIDLEKGKLRANLQGNQLQITEFSLHGGTGPQTRIAGIAGSLTPASALRDDKDGGLIDITGTLGWGPPPATGTAAGAGGAAGQPAPGPDIRMALTAKADKLRVSVRTDRQVTVSGSLTARLDNGQLTVRGGITADRAAIILPDSSAPTLGSDVHIHSAALDRAAAQKAADDAEAAGRHTQVGTAKPPDIVVTFDLGPDFAVQGKGLTTRLTGKLEIRSTNGLAQPPRVTGEIRTASGQYRAYGQALDIESGVISFSGVVDNPSLDIVAIRPNIAVRAGVRVTGSVQSPQVKLFSDPELPDAEKLAWVILGRSTANGGAEAAVLQQAALALLSGDKGGSGGIAKKFGLDEIGFKGPSSGQDASAAALTFGKRISQKLYVTYERSLSGAVGALYIFYDLTKRLTLRGQTGQQNGVDLIYTISYD